MRITVLLFATLRQKAGWNRKEMVVGAATKVEDLLQFLNSEYPQMRILQVPVYVAVNEEYADAQKELQSGDEVALFPPVSGGNLHGRQ